jgi:four helix bundle protein
LTDLIINHDKLSKSGGVEKSMLLVKDIYAAVKSFPKEETFALTSQIKRASVSVPANIAEGIGRNYKKDTIQFLHIARGSLYELETLLNIAVMLNMLNSAEYDKLDIQIKEILKVLNGLITYYEKSDLK